MFSRRSGDAFTAARKIGRYHEVDDQIVYRSYYERKKIIKKKRIPNICKENIFLFYNIIKMSIFFIYISHPE